MKKINLNNQPNFDKLFAQKERSPINYVVRPGSNFRHDIIFVSSYLHDARLLAWNLNKSKKTLMLKLERDRWEIYAHDSLSNRNPHLDSTLCSLSINEVARVEWTLEFSKLEEVRISKEPPLLLSNITLSASFWDHDSIPKIILRGEGWTLSVELKDQFPAMLLADTETKNPKRKKQKRQS